MDNLYKMLIKISFIILICILVNIAINIVIKDVRKKALKKNSAREYKALVTSLAIIKRIKTLLIYIFCIIAVLFQIPGLSKLSWSVLSGAGILSLILGYGAQKTLSNFFCGMGIAFSDAFEIGDFIRSVDMDCFGYVEDLTLRHTVIRTLDNRRVIIPNSRMDEMVVENYNHTDNEVCRFMEFPISFSADVDKAMNILKEEIGKLYNPNENGNNNNVEFPKVRVLKWADSSVILRGWVWGADTESTFDNMYHLNYVIKKRFDEEGIEIPYPYVNVVEKEKSKVKKA